MKGFGGLGISVSIGNVLTVLTPVTHSPSASLLGGMMPPPCCPEGEEGACVYVWLVNGGVPPARPVGRGRGAGSKAGHEQRFPLCALDMPKYTRDKIKVEIPPWLRSDPAGRGSAGGAGGGAPQRGVVLGGARGGRGLGRRRAIKGVPVAARAAAADLRVSSGAGPAPARSRHGAQEVLRGGQLEDERRQEEPGRAHPHAEQRQALRRHR